MQINGTILSIGQTITVSDKFSKREIVVTIDATSSYPQTVLFEANQDKCAILDKYKEGQEVSIDFNIKGRQWTNPQGEVKTFNSLQLWKIESVNSNTAAQHDYATKSVEPDNDLPF